uniref:Osiris 20 n=1 Tax=Heliothis virescens TaxID=7102 RepID=A0A2A4IWP1_HELVI
MKCLCLLLASVAIVRGYSIKDNEIQTARLRTSDELLQSVISDCFEAESPMSCLKVKVLSFLDTKLGVSSESARAFDDKNIDKVIFERVSRYLSNNEVRFQLPEFLFEGAEVSYRADRGLDVEIPESDSENGEARGILKKKLLLPVLLLLKLKMKALMPILVAIIGIKAMKALILSKLAITLVLGFLIYNLIMKKGAMPMMMMPPAETVSPAPQYGPPANQYGPPSTPAPSAPQDSYSPAWEPASSGPYARVWDPSQLAYSSYYPGDSSSSAASNQSPSYSSVSSVSSSSSSSATY